MTMRMIGRCTRFLNGKQLKQLSKHVRLKVGTSVRVDDLRTTKARNKLDK